MHRTNVYLTDEQERALDALAKAEGTTRSAALRAVLDRGLHLSAEGGGDLRAAFADLADHYEELTAGLFDDDPDLRIER